MTDSNQKIGYLILAHSRGVQVSRIVRALSGGNCRIALHLDARVVGDERADFLAQAREAGLVEEIEPVRCHWGGWSLVRATLNGLEHFRSSGDAVSHIVLISESHFPIRPRADLERFLEKFPRHDFIEAHDARTTTWVRGGMNLERFHYFFPFNFRRHRRAFDFSTTVQKGIGVKRSIPRRLRPHLGSQWWCLRSGTCHRILDYIREHPEVSRYFKSTWIPDESFFQTLAANLCDGRYLANVPFVLHSLTPGGRPHVFHNDHEPFLAGNRHHFFARKISPLAEGLFEALEARTSKPDTGEGASTTPNALCAEYEEFADHVAASYRFEAPVPGHLHDAHRELFLSVGQPVFAMIANEFTPAWIEKIAESLHPVPDLIFLGLPFRKDRVEIPGLTEKLGLGERSFEIRDRFTCQLFHEFFLRIGKGIAFAVEPDSNFESWLAFSNLKYFFPILLPDPDQPRYQQQHFVRRMREQPWAAGAPVLSVEEVGPHIAALCSRGLLSDLPDLESPDSLENP